MNRLLTFLLLASLSTLLTVTAFGTIYRSPTGNWIDVSNTIAVTTNWDTVMIPAGTWTWTNSELPMSGITLQGAGTNLTYIVDAMPSASIARLINCTTTTNALSRITGITFEDLGAGQVNNHGKIEMDARTGGAWRIDHCLFQNLESFSVYVHGNIGLIDHCVFILKVTAMQQYGITLTDGYGDLSWATPPTYGTTNALYVEACYFTNTVYGSASSSIYDGVAGARCVFRFDTIDNTFWANHGTDTSDRYRGFRQFELYGNTFTDNQSFYTPLDFRSGTGMCFSNTFTGYTYFDTIEIYRFAQPDFPWGQSNGTNQWDTNSLAVYSGTNFATLIGSLNDRNANWTVNQWSAPGTAYVAFDAGAGNIGSTYAPAMYSSLIFSNDATTLGMIGAKDFQIVYTNGDTYIIYQVLVSLDQFGRGSGDRIVDIGNYPNYVTSNTVTGGVGWPHESLEPTYSWSNSFNGTISGISSGYGSVLMQGRDYYTNTAAPGYAPLIFPHPLESLTNGSPPVNYPPLWGLLWAIAPLPINSTNVTVTNFSFELPNQAGGETDYTGKTTNGWTYASDSACILCANGNFWSAATAAPNGVQAISLLPLGGTYADATTTIVVNNTLTYTLNFYAAKPVNTSTPSNLEIDLDGASQATFSTGAFGATWVAYMCSLNIAAGSHTLKFHTTPYLGFSGLCLDAVSLTYP